MSRLVYLNGQYVAERDANISIFDSALMFGDMVFEMTRSFNQEQFKLRDHLERLMHGVKILRIPLDKTIQELEQLCHEVVEKNKPAFDAHDEHRLMINVSRGPLGIYADIFEGKAEPTIVVADFPLKFTVVGMDKLFDLGVNCQIPSQRNIPAELLDPKIKNRSRLHYMMANIQVSQCKGERNWPLLLDPDGFISEGTGDNFFMVKEGVVYTPEGRNILRGVSRDYVINLCRDLKIPCVEKNIEPYDVYTADEAFVTATPFCMLPVVTLNGNLIGSGRPGSLYETLLQAWSDRVGLDIRQQIKDFNQEVIMAKESDSPTPYEFKEKKVVKS